MSADPRYSSPSWKRTRKSVLARDRNLCQLRLEGCTYRATSVDHRIGVADGGPFWAMDNLQAACASCNSSKRNRDQAKAARVGRNEPEHDQPRPNNPDAVWNPSGFWNSRQW